MSVSGSGLVRRRQLFIVAMDGNRTWCLVEGWV